MSARRRPLTSWHSRLTWLVLVRLWRLCDAIELCLLRSIELTHATIGDWEQRFAPYLTSQQQKRRCEHYSTRRHVDDTSVKVTSQWLYLYHGIDRDRNPVDTMLNTTRNT